MKRTQFISVLIGNMGWDANTKRTRHYGLRIGDIVQPTGGKPQGEAEVVGYGFMDNNSAQLKMQDGTIKDWVTEWCDIVTKVEDRKLNKKHQIYRVIKKKK